MQLTIQVKEEICREAESRGLPVIDFVESLIHRGFVVELERPAVNSAIERIRALRSANAGARG